MAEASSVSGTRVPRHVNFLRGKVCYEGAGTNARKEI